MKFKVLITIVGVCLSVLLHGCTTINQPEEITLYVESHTPSHFMQNYGIPFELENEHIRVEAVLKEPGEPSNEYADLITIGGFEGYEEMVQDGELASLDPFVLKNSNLFSDLSYDKNKAIDILRGYSDQQLYALPLYLMGFALYYNADLFDEYDVPYPTDFISWEEVFELASQFPLETDQGDRIYGLAHSYAHYHVALSHLTMIGSGVNINMLDDEWNMTMNTPEWAEIWNSAIPAMKSGHIDISANDDLTLDAVIDYPFLDGRAAMIYATPDVASQLIREKKEEERFKWNVVAGPIIPEYPFTTAYYLWGAYGISEQSSHKEEAWELLRFIVEKNKTTNTIGEVSLAPFYAVDYEKSSFSGLVPDDVIFEVQEVASEIVHGVLEDRLTVVEALLLIQEEGQLILDERRLEYELGGEEG